MPTDNFDEANFTKRNKGINHQYCSIVHAKDGYYHGG
jgi:hypothetical protein